MPAPSPSPAPAPSPSPAPAPNSPGECIPQNNYGNFDLSSVFHVQKDYLFDVTTSNATANNAPEIVSYVSDVQKKLGNLSDKFKDANSSSQAVLAHQQNMLDIVNAEKSRLEQKKQLIDNADMQQEHVMILNNTYRKQYTEYTKMVIVVVICVSAFVLIRMMNDSMMVPEWIAILMHIVNIVVCMIVLTVIWANVKMRSKIDFEKLDLPPPNTGPAAASSSDLSNNSLLSAFRLQCYGEDCCDTAYGVVWSPTYQRCITVTKAAPAPPASPAPSPSPAPAPVPAPAPAPPPSAAEVQAEATKAALGILSNPGGKPADGFTVRNEMLPTTTTLAGSMQSSSPLQPLEPFEPYGRWK